MVFALPSHIGVRACRRFTSPCLRGRPCFYCNFSPAMGFELRGFTGSFVAEGLN